MHLPLPLIVLKVFLALLPAVSAQDCSATQLCATGCCSQYGFCGTDEAHCGTGCLSTCDFKLGCDKNNPCVDGTCCSQFGFCGLGPDYCSPANCVAGCSAKAYCDPGGYGAEYVNVTECPLNVCCSKWGYCGTTEEFCGDKTVQRPSCPNTTPIQRVVGYYEGWAARRGCQAFVPENIPTGVYTHLNFAFAGIDPNTFEVVPASADDVALYSSITGLKQWDSSLKVYISIGGWDFNNPGPTATTFSDLAASPANQQKFFVSLISFMSTYNFDGVDIDWEYPAADDRSGRPEDFVNYPIFIKNLKLALASNGGGRNGLTITLPVSYWYLQHFDIVSIEPWVDWFNMMSYDLHGLWDKGNKWLGNFLNSHTNLTEITEYMDLLWRNAIYPGKVNLGLAFYSRTFVASDPNCLAPACLFDSVGDPGPCTNSLGTLSNAELTDMMSQTGATSVLNEAAAVKILTIGKDWITYDDAESWALKLDFARSECMGGVMVWAVSQDYNNGMYSNQLQSVTNYTSPSIVKRTTGSGDLVTAPDSQILRNQCMWANCGQSCPDGYTTVPRSDEGASDDEVMQDSTYCHSRQLRVFCCPANTKIPKCGWFDFNNGKCGKQWNSVCPAGSENIIGPYSSEVGSYNGACANKQNAFEVACCETDVSITSDYGYADCIWEGTPPQCGVPWPFCTTTSLKTSYIMDSSGGSGAENCYQGKYLAPRPYCCNPPTADKEWLGCTTVFPIVHDDGICEAACPDGTVKVGMEPAPAYLSCKGGWAICCTPIYRTEATDANERETVYIEAMADVLANGCDWSTISSSVAARGLATAAPVPRKRGLIDHNYACNLAFADTFNMIASPYSGEGQYLQDGWNQAVSVSAGLSNVPATRIMAEPSGVVFSSMEPAEQTAWVQGVLNNVDQANKDNGPEEVLICPFFWDVDLALQQDEDDGGVDNGDPPTKMRRDLSEEDLEFLGKYDVTPPSNSSEINNLEKRVVTGASRLFIVRSAILNPISIRSSPYPNGNQGDDLLALNGDTHRYVMISRGCGPTDYTLETNANKVDSPRWVSEHILELQTISRFTTAIIDGQLPAVPSANMLAELFFGADPTIVNLFTTPFYQWTILDPVFPANRALAIVGSVFSTEGMVVADASLNAIKSQIYRFTKPVSVNRWLNCCGGNQPAHAQQAFSYIQLVMAVFDYYDAPDVKSRHGEAYGNVKQMMQRFETAYAAQTGTSITGDMQNAWRDYMRAHLRRMVAFSTWWVTDRLNQLRPVWYNKLRTASTWQEFVFAGKVLFYITYYKLQIFLGQKIYFDSSVFY